MGILSRHVLFNSARSLGRCENITATWNAYEGDKRFVGGAKGLGGFIDVSGFEEEVVVTDEFIRAKRPSQKVVMIAHGLTGGKLYGNDQPKGIFDRVPGCTSLVDYYIVSSEHGRAFAASAAGIPEERCLPLGMPRTDAYFGKRKGDGGTPLASKTAYVYAPTFRSSYDEPAEPLDFRAIDSMLEDGELLLVKRHMNTRDRLASGRLRHVMEVEPVEPLTPYLLDCDVLATDFSSCMFDAYVLGKPVVLTAAKSDPYLTTRGMYMKYPDEYSSRWVRASGNEEKFVRHLRAAAETGMRRAEEKCREKVASACDGHSAERVADLLERLVAEVGA